MTSPQGWSCCNIFNVPKLVTWLFMDYISFFVIAGRWFIWKLLVCGHQEVPGSLSLQEQGLPILPMSLLQISGHGLDGKAQAAGVPEQIHHSDVKLWPGGGDSTVQGSSVIQGLPEAHVGGRVLG